MDFGLFTNPAYYNADIKGIDKRSSESLQLLCNKIFTTDKEKFYKEKWNMYLYGLPRRGKTWVMHALLNHIIKVYNEKSVYFITSPDLYQYHITGAKMSDGSKWINFVASRKFLALDDLGQEYRSQSGFAETKIENFLRWRFNHGLTTFVSSNATLDTLKEVYGQSFADFISGEFISFDVSDGINMSEVILADKLRGLK